MKKKLPVEFYSPLLFSIIKSCCFSVERIWIFKGTITKTGIQKAATEKIKKTDSAFNSGEKIFSIIEKLVCILYTYVKNTIHSSNTDLTMMHSKLLLCFSVEKWSFPALA